MPRPPAVVGVANPSASSTHHTTQGTGTQGKTRGQDPGLRPLSPCHAQGRSSSRFAGRNAARFSNRDFADIPVESESVDDQTLELVEDQTSTGISTQTLASAATGASSFQTLCSSTAVSSASLSSTSSPTTSSSSEDLPPAPRCGCRAGDDDIGYLSAHPVCVCVCVGQRAMS